MSSSTEVSRCIAHLHRTELHGQLISVEKVKGDPSKKEMKKENDEKSSSRSSGDKKNMSDRSSKTQASVKKEEKRSSEKSEKKESKDTKKIEGKDFIHCFSVFRFVDFCSYPFLNFFIDECLSSLTLWMEVKRSENQLDS